MGAPEQHTPQPAAEEVVEAAGSTQSTPAGTAQGAVPPETAASAEPVDGAGDEAAAVEADLAELRAKAAQRDEYLALAQRTQADFENFRKRMSRDVGAAEGRGVSKLAKELLPALDNLDRAIAAAPEGQDSVVEGFRLVHADLTAALARLGIEGFHPKGEVFDPNQHEAISQYAVEGAATGTVVEVFQPGYRLNDTVLRPARVVVAA
jgi:molecular chaperone GrpE